MGMEIGPQFTMNEMIRVYGKEGWLGKGTGREKGGSNSSCPETIMDLCSFVKVREMSEGSCAKQQ
jgi:hypothetical protein